MKKEKPWKGEERRWKTGRPRVSRTAASKDLASSTLCPCLACHPPLQWGCSRVITDDDPEARSTARAHRVHSCIFVSRTPCANFHIWSARTTASALS
ncbi:hypothetical protein ACQKWADRAFT_283789 [Trichoderma austrokoningii]